MFGKEEFLYDCNGMKLGRKSEDLHHPGLCSGSTVPAQSKDGSTDRQTRPEKDILRLEDLGPLRAKLGLPAGAEQHPFVAFCHQGRHCVPVPSSERDVCKEPEDVAVTDYFEGAAQTPHGPPEDKLSLLEFAEELVELERRRAKLLEQRDEFIKKLQSL